MNCTNPESTRGAGQKTFGPTVPANWACPNHCSFTLGTPYTYWGVGCIDPATYRAAADAGRVAEDVPVNHSPTFAPVIQPTLDTGTEALVVAALAWLGSEGGQ